MKPWTCMVFISAGADCQRRARQSRSTRSSQAQQSLLRLPARPAYGNESGENRIREQNRPLHGFTVVELLVVIGIITLLVAILLPALNKGRQAAQAIACRSNLRQIGIGIELYVSSSRGWMPMPRFSSNPTRVWYNEVDDSRALPIGQRRSVNRVWVCPAYPFIPKWAEATTSGGGILTYGMNYELNGSPAARLKKASVRQPSGKFLLADAFDRTGSSPWRVLTDQADAWRMGQTNDGFGMFHSGNTANILFFDGHVESRRIENVPAYATRAANAAAYIEFWRP